MFMLNGNVNDKTALKTSKSNYGWVLIIILLFGAIVDYLDRVNLSVANTTIAAEFGLGPIQMGLLLSAFMWPYALANLPSGWIVDKMGPKKIFTYATILWSIATIIGGCAVGFKSMYASRVLLGIAEAPFFICGAKVAQKWFTDEERAFPTSIYNMGPQIANAIAPPLLTLVMINSGWRPMFIGLGVFGFLVTFVWLKFYKDKEDTSVQAEKVVKNNEVENTKVSWAILFKHPSTWAMMMGNFGINYTFWVFLTWLPGYLRTARGLSLMKTGWMASIPFIAGMFGVPLGGFLSDYLIKKKGFTPIKARKTIIVCAAILAAAAVAPVPYVKDINTAIMLLSIGFFASSMPPGVFWTLPSDVAPYKLVGSLGAIQNFAGYIGATFAPIITGIIIAKTNSYNLVFVVSSMFCLFGALCYGVFLRKKITIEE